ncbi:MAG: PLP-dependent aminotransferase family protein [Deltaproteobacteria bacterium]|nr:MAG: PLP-dependent aminotransferase family protein [Deltaproteobacteria bacterium]
MTSVEITQVSTKKGWIDFGIGQPDVDLLPLAQLAKAAAHRFKLKDRNILQYGNQQGSGDFRISLASFLGEQYGETVDPDELFVTAGISQALDLICALHTRPGDTVIVEEPSYFLALRIFADYKLNIIGTPIDENGLIIDALEEKLAKYNPVFIYTIPTFHNPAGVTLPVGRRKELVRLSDKYDFLIVADEVYQMLYYASKPPLPMAYYDASNRVISLGSFSKILAPGLRLGWMHARPSLLEPFISCGYLDSGGGLNPFVSSIVSSLIKLGQQKEYLNFLKQTYRTRMTTLTQALRQHIPALQFTDPQGGYFIWSCLPEGTDTEILLAAARKHKVGFQTGIRFSSAKGLRNYLRFCFAFYGEEQLLKGVERLSRIIR